LSGSDSGVGILKGYVLVNQVDNCWADPWSLTYRLHGTTNHVPLYFITRLVDAKRLFRKVLVEERPLLLVGWGRTRGLAGGAAGYVIGSAFYVNAIAEGVLHHV